jgi:Ca-activated chloride channel family protein
MNTDTLNLRLNTDAELIPLGHGASRILELTVQAPGVLTQENRPALNLALVLDRSGSMRGGKLAYARQAASHVLDLLQEQDSVALVAYDDEINLLSPSVRVTSDVRNDLKRRISRLEPGGSTNLSGGWLEGCREAAAGASEGSLNRALLLTDGQANVGILDLEELSRHARELSRRGVSTSTFGVGDGFNEHLLEAMSNQGGGNFYYIANPGAIPEIFQREFKELAAVTARDVELMIYFPAEWRLDVPGGWRTEFSEGRLRIFLGSLYANQIQEINIRLRIPAGDEPVEKVLTATVTGAGEQAQVFNSRLEARFQVVDPAVAASAAVRNEVVQHFALVYVAEIANESLKMERRGDNQRASELLKRVLAEFQPYLAQSDYETYIHTADRMLQGMDEMDRKASHYNSYNQKRHKPL